MPVKKRKATGAHFTAPDLAKLIAERVAALISDLKGLLRLPDPACGDGNLLCAINDALPPDVRRRVTLVGIENDEASFASLRARRANRNANERSSTLIGLPPISENKRRLAFPK